MELNNNVLDKQLKISFPLITSVHVLKRKATLKNIYVGKEIGQTEIIKQIVEIILQ